MGFFFFFSLLPSGVLLLNDTLQASGMTGNEQGEEPMGKCSKTPVLANRLLNVSLWSTEEAGQGSKEMMYQLLQP